MLGKDAAVGREVSLSPISELPHRATQQWLPYPCFEFHAAQVIVENCLYHCTAHFPPGAPTRLLILLALVMRVLLNKILALFLLCISAVDSQHIYLAHRIWKDKYIKQQNLNKQVCHLLVMGKRL